MGQTKTSKYTSIKCFSEMDFVILGSSYDSDVCSSVLIFFSSDQFGFYQLFDDIKRGNHALLMTKSIWCVGRGRKWRRVVDLDLQSVAPTVRLDITCSIYYN